VLLSERNPEPSRTNRLQTLPHGGLPKLVVLRGGARPNPEVEGGRTFAQLTIQPAETTPATQPDELQPDESHPDETETSIDPLYLFPCGVSWRKHRNACAGWELIRCLSSSRQTAKIAAAMLAQTESLRLPAQEPVRAIESPGKPPTSSEPVVPTSVRQRRG
jgi:hypothetical protein